jgi:DNA-binding XRE family transcriptional regulator
MLENPFRALRKKLGLGVRDMALAVNVSNYIIYSAEGGRDERPRRYAKALEALGLVKADEILAEYAAWHGELQAAKREELKNLAKGLV